MKLSTFLLVPLVCSINAAPLRKSSYTNNNDNRNLKKKDDTLTMDREIDEEGQIPQGRKVHIESDHPVKVPEGKDLAPPKESEDDGDGRKLSTVYCDYCWWDPYYGYVTFCCDYYYNYCAYYYC